MRDTAIRNTHPSVVTIDEGILATDAQGNSITLDEALIAKELERLQAEYDAQQYARDRAAVYPSLQDQLDDIYHNGVDGWKASITAIKAEYPKP